VPHPHFHEHQHTLSVHALSLTPPALPPSAPPAAPAAALDTRGSAASSYSDGRACQLLGAHVIPRTLHTRLLMSNGIL